MSETVELAEMIDVDVDVDVDLIEIDIEIDTEERHRRRRVSYIVTVRSPAGFESHFRVYGRERVATLARVAITHFESRGQLQRGDYALEKIAGGTTEPLTPTATLEDSGVGPRAVCALVVAGAQVDG